MKRPLRQPKLSAPRPKLYNGLAWLLATCRTPGSRPARAVELAREAVKLTPTDRLHWITLGVAYYRAGEWKEAQAALTRALEIQRGIPGPAAFFLAMTQQKLGNKEEARKVYDKAVQWMKKIQPRNDELIRFRKEAAELLASTTRRTNPTPEAGKLHPRRRILAGLSLAPALGRVPTERRGGPPRNFLEIAFLLDDSPTFVARIGGDGS